MKKIYLVLLLSLNIFAGALDKGSKEDVEKGCSHLENHAATVAFLALEKMNKITYETWDKENSNVEVLLSKKIDYKSGITVKDEEFYRQVYKITFKTLDGKDLMVITDNIASSYECSITSPDVYLLVGNQSIE